MIITLMIVWWIGGLVGYLMIRQGFLVSFESALGKREAWDVSSVVFGIFSAIILGPLFIIVALVVKGRNCFGSRQK